MSAKFLKQYKQFNQMAVVTMLTENELQEQINNAVQKALIGFQPTKAVNRKKNLDISEAIEFLTSIGYKCSLSLIYKKTMANEIPVSKFGRRVSFNADDLTKWIEQQKTKTVDLTGVVARSANLKLGRY